MRLVNKLEAMGVNPEFSNAMSSMVKFLLALLFIQLLAWLLPAWTNPKGIPNYIPWHEILESISIVISMMVFAVGWNSKNKQLSGNVVLLASVFFSVGVIDFLHTMTYVGMPEFFTPNDSQKHLNYWLSARFLAAVILLVIVVREWKPLVSRITRHIIFSSLVIFTLSLNWAVTYHQSWFPDTFIPGQGLTQFKKNFEYMIIVINLVTAVILLNKMSNPQPYKIVMLFGAVCTLAMSEFYFTIYTTMLGSYNILGHVYKVIAYLLIYRSIVVEVIEEPYYLLELANNELEESETRYRHILEQAPIGIVTNNIEGHFIKVNEAFCRMLGYSKEELEALTFQDVTHPDDKTLSFAERRKLLDGEIDSYQLKKRYFHKDGHVVWGQLTSSLEKDIQGDPFFIAQVEDITERKLYEDELRLAASVYQNSSEGMLITDTDSKIVAINPAFTELTGYNKEEVVGKTPKILQSGRQSKEFYDEMWKQLKNQGLWEGELWNRRKDGSIYAEYLNINAEIDADGKIHRYVGLFSDITDKKEKDELIWKQASFDALTGLPNRRLFHDRLEQETKMSLRSGLSLGLLFIDLDRFKEVNDTLGHAKGDALLVETTKRIRNCVRETDTVARLGGDEFTVIVPAYTEVINLDRIVQNILHELSSPFELGDGDQGHVSASIGISLFPEDTDKVDDLLRYVDQAMYEAKLLGRNCSSYFKSSMQAKALEKMSLTNELRVALSKNELEVYFQPIVDCKTGKINKAEALLRWKHPTRGMINPATFIPLAEDSGLILEIGEWVFMEAINTIELWLHETGKLIQVSVNKSPVQFVRAERHPWLDRLASSRLPNGCITVEITEGLLITDSARVRGELLSFLKQGIEVSIDDFGTGFSSLSYLNQFDIDYLKIDISFIQSIVENESNRALTEAIIVMAHKLGIKTIAEGVETEAQRDVLIQFGCDYIQGFLYSKPVTATEFMNLIRT